MDRKEKIDLMKFACSRRESLVLKPNDDYGGHGIVCGWQVTRDDWQNELARAVNDSYVVQERVMIPEVRYPHGKRWLRLAPWRACSVARVLEEWSAVLPSVSPGASPAPH